MDKEKDFARSFAAYQCKGFFEAYQALKEIACKQTQSRESGSPLPQIFPWMVNGIFAAELAIKVLLMYRDISYDRVHELINLLFLLPDELMLEFLGEIKNHMGNTYSVDYISRGLIQISNAFQEWRYIYEMPSSVIDTGFVDVFVTSICTVALRHHDVQFIRRNRYPQTSPEFGAIDQKLVEADQTHYNDAVTRLQKLQKKQLGGK